METQPRMSACTSHALGAWNMPKCLALNWNALPRCRAVRESRANCCRCKEAFKNEGSVDVASLSKTRREQLILLGVSSLSPFENSAFGAVEPSSLPSSSWALSEGPLVPPDYTEIGPFEPIKLPPLEHTCTVCDASADRCRLKIQGWVPRGGARIGLKPPYPLVIITPGFLLKASSYESLARHLSSWGYVAVIYDQNQAAFDPTSDVVSVAFIRDLIDWCRATKPVSELADTENIYLIGHSRGGKISTLTAVEDPRVKSLFLIDPVDVTVYAPLSPEYPSATAALEKSTRMDRKVPVGILGSGLGGDCVPADSNYETFYSAAPGLAWEGVIGDAGHLQFIDGRGKSAMDLICQVGAIPDATVRMVAQAMVVAWGELTLPRKGVSADSKIDSSKLRLGQNASGSLALGEVSYDPIESIFVTENNIKRKGSRASILGEKELRFTSRGKNFEMADRMHNM